jgi:hypothetical protein
VVWISCLTNNFCDVQLFFPLGLATAIFSTQGVLPFTPNLARFTYVLFILSVLIVVSLVVLFNWESWLQSVVDHLLTAGKLFRTAIIAEKSEKICDVSTLARKFRQTFFRSSTSSQQDLETGLPSPPESPNFRSRMISNHAAPWSLRGLMSFSYSPLSTSDGGQADLDGRLHEDRATSPTTDSLSPTFNFKTETNPPSLHFSRVYTPIRKRSPFISFTSISNVLKRLLRPAPESDKRRIEWTCVSKAHPALSYYILISNCRDVVMSYMQTFRVVH